MGEGSGGRTKGRGLRLTPEARQRLEEAFVIRWREERGAGTPTRAAWAKAIGIGDATLERIMAGKPADRTMILLTFAAVKIPWDPRYLLSETPEPEAEPPHGATPPDIELNGSEPTGEPSSPGEPGASVRQEPPEHEGDLQTGAEPEAQAHAPEAPRAGRRAWVPLAVVASVFVVGIAVGLGFAMLHKEREPSSMDNVCSVALEAGFAAYHDGDYAKATSVANYTADFARRQGLRECLSSSYWLQGQLAAERGELSLAQERDRAALALRTGRRDGPARAAILETLGDVQTRMGDWKGAKESLLGSMREYDATPDPVGVAMAQRDLGTLAYKSGDLTGADEWLGKSLESLRGRSKPDIEMDVRARQALVLAKRERSTEARASLEECLRYWTRLHHPHWVPATQIQLAMIEAESGDRRVAAVLYRKARAGYENVGDRAGVRDADARLAALASGVARR